MDIIRGMRRESVDEIIFMARLRERERRNGELRALIQSLRGKDCTYAFRRMRGLNVEERETAAGRVAPKTLVLA